MLSKITITKALMYAFVCGLGIINACYAQTRQSVVNFDIAQQPLASALVVFSVQADVNVIGLNDTLSQYTAPMLRGRMRVEDALQALLVNTKLRFHFLTPQSVSIVTADYKIDNQPERADADIASDYVQLEEVVVSATRRELNLQDTPIAVTALDQQSLNRHQIKDLREMTHIVPGLEMVNTGQQAAILVQLRGVGTTNITEIADGPVAIHIDGVYSPRSQGVGALLYDIDSVEVLRGPQGTLFGRNSSSGSINVYTKSPELNALNADFAVTYGNYDHKRITAAVNIPISDVSALRIAGTVNRHSAYTQLLNNYAGIGPQYPSGIDDLGDYDQALDLGQQGPETADQSSWRLSALWQPTDAFSANVSAEHYRDNGTGIAQLDPTLVEKGIRGVVFDSPSSLDLENDTLRARLQYQFAYDYTLSYIAGVSTMTRQQVFDADNGRDGSFEQQSTHGSTFKFYSHELQLHNGDLDALKWVVGAFSSREKNSIVFAIDQQNAGGSRSPVGASSWISDHGGAAVSYAIQPDRRVESLGVFAQAAYDIDSSTRLTGGIRYTDDSKSDHRGRTISCRVTSVLGPYLQPGSLGPSGPTAQQLYADAGASAAIAQGLPYDNGTNVGIGSQPCWVRQVNDFATGWENTSGLLRYDVDWFDHVMAYGSVSTGFKSGHIQDAGDSARPETVINYELGMKSRLFNNTMRFNAALYQARYDDLQFSNQDRLDTNGDGVADTGGSTVVRNASEATIQGLELELSWAISADDRLQFVGSLMDARFDRFEIPDTLFGNVFNPYVSSQSNAPTDLVDLSGNAPPRTPEWKFTLVYEHSFRFSSGSLTPRVVATFSDDYFLDIYNRDKLAAGVFPSVPNGARNLGVQNAYQLYDLSLRFQPVSNKWLIEAFVKNATDENIKIDSGNFITENGFVATYMPPRTFGVTLEYSLGDNNNLGTP